MGTMFDLVGRKAIVTGGTRGLGHSMAEGLMEAGAEVVIWGSTQRVQEVAEEFCSRGFCCHGVTADLSQRDSLAEGFLRSMALLGGQVDILVNGAGIQSRHSCAEFPISEWDRLLEVNLTAAFQLAQLAGREMLQRGYGRIINIASMTSFFGGMNSLAYASSKGAIAQMTKALCNDWARKGITVNAIAPGYMATDMNKDTRSNTDFYNRIAERIPAGRWGCGDDMKGLCVFLASDASAYLNGAVIPLDGGYLCNG